MRPSSSHSGSPSRLSRPCSRRSRICGSPEIRKKYDAEFRAGAVRNDRETGEPVARIARDPGIDEGTLTTWVSREREAPRTVGTA
ncbi:transposase [Streptomyces monashensis]|uniref:transposase n=1 Tax=Streptomyces monashensis TaxID=1678012 RepID=UPI0033F9EB61